MFRINCFEICITSQNFVEPFISPKTLKVFKKKQIKGATLDLTYRLPMPDLTYHDLPRPTLPWMVALVHMLPVYQLQIWCLHT